MAKTRVSIFLWLAAAFLAAPVAVQASGGIDGRYRVVDDQTGEEAVARLDFGRVEERGNFLVLTLFLPPEAPGEPGTYKVFAGFTGRGGLGNPYARLQEAKNPFQMLKRPGLLLRNAGENLKPGFSCQVELGLEGLPYTCSDDTGHRQSGRMLKLSPAPPPIPVVLQENIPGFYRVLDDGGGEEALARLEFKQNTDLSSGTVLTLFSRPSSPDVPGTYRVFFGHVLSQTWSFHSSLQELSDPYGQLRRPSLLRTVPDEILVPGFSCSLGSPTTADIFFRCQSEPGDVQSGLMIKLR